MMIALSVTGHKICIKMAFPDRKGANIISLNEAKARYEAFGTLDYVDELRSEHETDTGK